MGLRCLALEKQGDVGGLWKRLPPWQDIQNRKEDFAIGDVHLDGVKRGDVLRYVRGLIRGFGLSDRIKLRCEVTSVAWRHDRWRVQTDRGSYEGTHLVVASGTQNEPLIPEVDRSSPNISERHSSALERPEDLTGRRVTVVGGGASAYDLLDLAIEHGASRLDWVYRKPRWFLPTMKAKQAVWPNIREMAIVQTVAHPATVSAFLQGLLREEYKHFGLEQIEPAEAFDIRKQMLLPGRSQMVRHLRGITTHQSEVRSIERDTVALANGERFDTDLLLWGTGYRMDLAYLDLPEYRQVRKHRDLSAKLGSLVRAVDHPNLFFIGVSLSDTTSSTPFFAALEAKSVVAHILGKCEIPTTTAPDQVTHWHLFKHFAAFDHANYRRFWWRPKYALLAWWYAALRHKHVKV